MVLPMLSNKLIVYPIYIDTLLCLTHFIQPMTVLYNVLYDVFICVSDEFLLLKKMLESDKIFNNLIKFLTIESDFFFTFLW